MRSFKHVVNAAALTGLAVALLTLGVRAADPPEFKPDASFKGSVLTGWRTVGQAQWRAENGEIIGRATAGGNGGWLVMDKEFQDLLFYTNLRCEGSCKTGVLLRAEKMPDGGMKGVYVSLTDGDFATYKVTIDAQGVETSRTPVVAAARGGGAGGRAGAPPAGAPAAGAPAAGAPAAGAPAGGAPAGAGAAPAGGRRGGGGGGGGRGGAPAITALKPGQWNPLEILVSDETVRASMGGGGSIAEPGYGSVALYIGGTGEVRYKDVAWKDLIALTQPKEQLSNRFTAVRISDFYYGWSAAASDINHDGVMDVVSGPFYYLGPTFADRKIYRTSRVYNPGTEYAPDMVNFTADFTGDGWPDILASDMVGGRPMDLYVNPKGQSRRWDHARVLPVISTELVLMRDLDDDGKPEIIFGGGGAYSWAHPDPVNPMAVWTSHNVSKAGERVVGHGIGVGDVNSDGRQDIVVPTGWYEQPPKGSMDQPWTLHPAEFGNGGGEIGAYDVNGDKLTDVVTSLAAHDFGLAWFQQKKGADGSVTWEKHEIAEDFSTKNAGEVVFSEPHASRFADMNGDKIPDFIVGKRYWSHLENYNGPDPYGPAVVYIYRTVRNPKAPGGAEFVPELVHNRSGVGSAFEVLDLNKDGRLDLAVAGAYGTHVFLSKPAAAAAPPAR